MYLQELSYKDLYLRKHHTPRGTYMNTTRVEPFFKEVAHRAVVNYHRFPSYFNTDSFEGNLQMLVCEAV